MATEALGSCRACGGAVSREAPACPHCGAPDPVGAGAAAEAARLSRRRWGCGALLAFVVLALIVGQSDRQQTSAPPPARTAQPDRVGAPAAAPGPPPVSRDSILWAYANSICTHPSRPRLRRLMRDHGDWSDETIGAVTCRRIQMGMTAEQVRAAWGRPDVVNAMQFSTGRHEQWVYGERDYVYLDDSVVTSWQSSRSEVP